MSVKAFIDTNIFLYAAIQAPDTAEKRETAITLLRSNEKFVISTQVLNEFSAVLLKKQYADDVVWQKLESIVAECTVTLVTLETLRTSHDLRKRFRFSYWDSLIVASALQSRCTILYSEDMQHSLLVNDTLRISNPFTRSA